MFSRKTVPIIISYGLGITLLIVYFYWLRQSVVTLQSHEIIHESALDKNANLIDSIPPAHQGLPSDCDGYELISGDVSIASRIFLAEKHNTFCKSARADCVNVLADLRYDDSTNSIVLFEYAPYGFEILCEPDNMLKNCRGWNVPPQEWHELEVTISKHELIRSLLKTIIESLNRYKNEDIAIHLALQIFNETIDSENHLLTEYLAAKNKEFNSLLKHKPQTTKDIFYSSADRYIAELSHKIAYLKKLITYCEKLMSYHKLINQLNIDRADAYGNAELLQHNQMYMVTRPNSYLFKALKDAQKQNQTAYVHLGQRHIIKPYHQPADPSMELVAALNAERKSEPYAVLLCSRRG
jgi:hypothetical protein